LLYAAIGELLVVCFPEKFKIFLEHMCKACTPHNSCDDGGSGGDDDDDDDNNNNNKIHGDVIYILAV